VRAAASIVRGRHKADNVKLALVVLVALLIVAHMRRPEWHVLDAGIFVVSLAIVWLGIVVAGGAGG